MRILVTAASRYGGTAGIAEAITESLSGRGLETQHLHPKDVESLADYDAVVLGSAVYESSWLDETLDFVARFKSQLRKRPVWLFSSGPLGEESTIECREETAVSVIADTKPQEHRIFSGRIDKRQLNAAERAYATMARAAEGDYRDWDAIDTWAETIADHVLSAGATSLKVSLG